jgi:hypothetical protein
MSTLGRRTASYRASGSEGWDTPSCPVEQISEKLEDALTLLTGGGRMAVPRQRTLKGTLDWSHDLLGNRNRSCSGGSQCSPVVGRWRPQGQ